MILKRGVKIQLLVFALITVIGVTYTAVRYVGVGRNLVGDNYTAYVDLTESGGIFSNAEVTYRGVAVGRVGPIELTKNGIRVKLEMRGDHKIPSDTVAVVANRSAVGEQYIDLQPRTDKGPFLSDRVTTIPAKDTRLPVSTSELLTNVDKLVASVNPKDLGTIVDELDLAFSGSASDLQAILDSSDRLLKVADENYPATEEVINNSKVVLDTQRAQGGNIKNFARNLNVLTDQIRQDDPAIRTLIDNTVPVTVQVNSLTDGLAPTLPVLLANLTTTGQVLASREDHLRSLFIIFPLAVAGAFTVTPGDGTQHLGLQLNFSSPEPCRSGYEKVKARYPQKLDEPPARLDVGCNLPKTSQQVVRGSRNAPPGKPYPTVPAGATDGAGFPAGGAYGTSSTGKGKQAAASTGGTSGSGTTAGSAGTGAGNSAETVTLAAYDPSTGAVYGPDGKRYVMPRAAGQRTLGEEASWKWLLLGPLTN